MTAASGIPAMTAESGILAMTAASGILAMTQTIEAERHRRREDPRRPLREDAPYQ